LSFFKGVLGTKRSSPNWAVLRECGHEPLRFNWFRAAARLFNGMLHSNSEVLRQVTRADCQLRFRVQHCWTAEFLAALAELEHGQEFVDAVVGGEELSVAKLCSDVRSQNRRVWEAVHGLDPREHASKLVTFHNWIAAQWPEHDSSSAAARKLADVSLTLPAHLCRLLPRHVVSNVSRFRLRAHHLRVESVHWLPGSVLCDRCPCREVQDEKHVLFYCRDSCVCALRQKYASLFEHLFRPLQHFSVHPQPFLLLHHQVSDQEVIRFLEQKDKHLPYFLSELMDVFNLAGNDQQAEQPTPLAEGQPPL
jgi:hypothetical protein